MSEFFSSRYIDSSGEYLKNISATAYNSRTILDYSVPKYMGLSQQRLIPLINSIGIWSAVILKHRNGYYFVAKKENTDAHISFLTNCGYQLRSANDLNDPIPTQIARNEKFEPSDRRFVVGASSYGPKVLEAIEYYKPEFELKIVLKRNEHQLLIPGIKSTEFEGPLANILIALSKPNTALNHSLLLSRDKSRQAGRYKELVNEVIARAFSIQFPHTKLTEIQSTLKDQLMLGTSDKTYVRPQKVQFIFPE